MKALGIDFGASFVDAVLFDGKKIIAKRSVARQEYSPHFLDEFPAFDTVCTTGSKPHQQMKYYGELESIGDGGLFCLIKPVHLASRVPALGSCGFLHLAPLVARS